MARWKNTLRRWWRRFGVDRNPLRRRSDRVEAVALIGAAVIALVAIPLAFNVHTAAYQAGARASAERTATAVQTTAVLLEDGRGHTAELVVRVPVPKPMVPAAWLGPDGMTRTGLVEVTPGASAGDRVPVWMDRNGSVVDAPATPVDVTVDAVVAAVGTGLGWLLLVRVIFAVVRWVLDRRRFTAWGVEWERVERKWRKWAL